MKAIVVIGGSAGSLHPLMQIVAALQYGSRASIFVVIHIGAGRSQLPSILERAGLIPSAFARDGEEIEQGRLYVAPPDCHMLLEHSHIRLSQSAKVHFTRPAVDPLFESAASAFGNRVVGVVLSGGDGDGAEGLRVIKKHGGLALVQDPEEAVISSMPHSAMMLANPDGCLPITLLASRVRDLSL